MLFNDQSMKSSPPHPSHSTSFVPHDGGSPKNPSALSSPHHDPTAVHQWRPPETQPPAFYSSCLPFPIYYLYRSSSCPPPTHHPICSHQEQAPTLPNILTEIHGQPHSFQLVHLFLTPPLSSPSRTQTRGFWN